MTVSLREFVLGTVVSSLSIKIENESNRSFLTEYYKFNS